MCDGDRLVPVFGPAGERTWIHLRDNMTVKQLKEKLVEQLARIPGPIMDNVRVTLNGNMMDQSLPLSECKFLPSCAFHFALGGGRPGLGQSESIAPLPVRTQSDSPELSGVKVPPSDRRDEGERAEIHTAAQEKCYNPHDPTMTFVDADDDLDFLCEDFQSRRALMSCGHAVTPMSLTNWCRRLLDEGKSRFVCGQSGCDVEWPFSEVCKMALLTPEEKKYFEKTMASNAARGSAKLCPKCKSSVVRKNPSNLRVRCAVCPTTKGRTYKFCWQCLREWKGPAPCSDHCGNDGCTNESLKTLKTCPNIKPKFVSSVSACPSIRACPTCGVLLQYANTGCKNIVCPRCKVKFCFVCLKRTDMCMKISNNYMNCLSGVAPRQTTIPVWKKQ
ncbi:hypothetical protein Q5P01_002583 [Channa striata]|uniref:RING-type domain-containing protein n=1 Tax=Channa striata TaxID=64152 RepID=A0AA88NPG4_CHASR|nr:hypothetical protein Q5P01_002583 [Channa striata]